jgi:hypothetical protein
VPGSRARPRARDAAWVDELLAQFTPQADRSRREVHQPGPRGTPEGHVEVVVRDLRPPARSLEGRGVDLEELLRVDGTIVLFSGYLAGTWWASPPAVSPQ